MLDNKKLERIVEFAAKSNRATPVNMELAEAYLQDLLKELATEKNQCITLAGLISFAGKDSEELVAGLGDVTGLRVQQIDIIVEGLQKGKGR